MRAALNTAVLKNCDVTGMSCAVFKPLFYAVFYFANSLLQTAVSSFFLKAQHSCIIIAVVHSWVSSDYFFHNNVPPRFQRIQVDVSTKKKFFSIENTAPTNQSLLLKKLKI